MRFVIYFIAMLALAQAKGKGKKPGSVRAEQTSPKISTQLLMNNKPMFDRMSAAVLEKLPTDGKVLDLASGPGEPCITLATMDANAQIVCSDLQPSMNEQAKARARAANVTNVRFQVIAADNLSQWSDNSFHAVTMSFGLMFVRNKKKSLNEIFRVLKPGGSAYISLWKTLTFKKFAHKVLEEVASTAVPEFTLNPQMMMEDLELDTLKKKAKESGFQVVGDELMTYSYKMGSSEEAADGCITLVGGILKQMEADGDTDAEARFYDIAEKQIKNNGWRVRDQVVIPDNSAQLLILRKSEDELLNKDPFPREGFPERDEEGSGAGSTNAGTDERTIDPVALQAALSAAAARATPSKPGRVEVPRPGRVEI